MFEVTQVTAAVYCSEGTTCAGWHARSSTDIHKQGGLYFFTVECPAELSTQMILQELLGRNILSSKLSTSTRNCIELLPELAEPNEQDHIQLQTAAACLQDHKIRFASGSWPVWW